MSKVFVLLDNDPVSIFGIYSSSKKMIYAYNNLTQKEKNNLKEFMEWRKKHRKNKELKK